uniref:Uncharacterized protein n=1 Tax=Strongyloides papillosus TaxID=174720 RepID=A0A0N5C0W1_STREA
MDPNVINLRLPSTRTNSQNGQENDDNNSVFAHADGGNSRDHSPSHHSSRSNDGRSNVSAYASGREGMFSNEGVGGGPTGQHPNPQLNVGGGPTDRGRNTLPVVGGGPTDQRVNELPVVEGGSTGQRVNATVDESVTKCRKRFYTFE